MAPVSSPKYQDHDELTGQGVVNVISYWPASQRTRWHDARICHGETGTNTFNCFDLCYSFKMLCWVEYEGTHQLHLAAKNYAQNYAYTAGIHPNWWIPYERALRNLTVLMFSHLVHQLENSRSFEGHWTLIVHKCLQVAGAPSRYHRWQCWANLQEASSTNWNKILAVAKNDFRYKYSPALTLLGKAQNLAYAHPKLLGRCYDVYYGGWFIGDLLAWGKLPTEEQSKKVYTQEYKEVVTLDENSIDLTEKSPTYPIAPTSLVNPDIVLPHRIFQECQGLLELPAGQNLEPREYEMDGVWNRGSTRWMGCGA